MIMIEVPVIFGIICVLTRYFKKEGLIAWMAIAGILANLFTAKSSMLFGDPNLGCTLGTVLFASTFLCTDILSEKYGTKVARDGVILSTVAVVFFILASQWALLYPTAPWSEEVQAGMSSVFAISTRVSISSVVMFVIANLADVYIYDKIRKKTNGKYMWLRNNVSTILCNCLENFFFMFGAFLFVEGYTVGSITVMALITSAIETVIGLCDTPFLYLGVSLINKGKDTSATV